MNAKTKKEGGKRIQENLEIVPITTIPSPSFGKPLGKKRDLTQAQRKTLIFLKLS